LRHSAQSIGFFLGIDQRLAGGVAQIGAFLPSRGELGEIGLDRL
jgi:hypothetical protein